jgi:predicted CXXCH cytochrome family protein
LICSARILRDARDMPGCFGLLVLVVGLTGCPSPGPVRRAPPSNIDIAPGTPVASNILRRDYVGSAECSYCHAEIYNAWLRSPMHGMTRDASGATIRAPFTAAVFRFKGDQITMETRGSQRFMRLHTRADGESLYRITRVIGGRYREDFVGVNVTGKSDSEADPGEGDERVMPVSYVFATESWRYKGYSVLVKERPRLQVAGVWRTGCVFCHNTVPYFSTLFDDLQDRRASYQGSVSNHLLPVSRRWEVVATNRVGLVRALREEIEFLGGDGSGVSALEDGLSRAIETTRERFRPEHFVEVGIGCESCHGGSRQHAADPRLRPTFEVRSDIVGERPVSGTRSPSRTQWINRTCMRCHTVLFTRYAYTWEGGHRYRNPGGSNINSSEARDFALGGCANQLSCTSCHDPHAEDSPEALRALGEDAGTQLCTSCHLDLRSREAVAAHSHHDPDGAGASCIGCHMPRKNLGLGYRLTRYHRIGTPADRVRVENDRPLECALCHTDRSVAFLVDTMERWWGRSYSRDRLRAIYGRNLSVNPLRATLRRGKPHEQAVAAVVLGEARDSAEASAIAEHLAHPYPLVRYFAAQALFDLHGEWPAVDLDADAPAIQAQARQWLAAYE